MSRHQLDDILAAFPAPPPLFPRNSFHQAREALPGSQLNACYENTKNFLELSTDPEKNEAHSQNSTDTDNSSAANFRQHNINLISSRFSERLGKILGTVECSASADSDASSSIYEQERNHLPPKQFMRKLKNQTW